MVGPGFGEVEEGAGERGHREIVDPGQVGGIDTPRPMNGDAAEAAHGANRRRDVDTVPLFRQTSLRGGAQVTEGGVRARRKQRGEPAPSLVGLAGPRCRRLDATAGGGRNEACT